MFGPKNVVLLTTAHLQVEKSRYECKLPNNTTASRADVVHWWGGPLCTGGVARRGVARLWPTSSISLTADLTFTLSHFRGRQALWWGVPEHLIGLVSDLGSTRMTRIVEPGPPVGLIRLASCLMWASYTV